MAKFVYRGFFDDLMAGDVDGADIRSILVMDATTCDTEPGARTFADFDAVDEFDGVGYVPLDHTIESNGWDEGDGRWEIHTAVGEAYTEAGSLSSGTRDVQGVVFKRYVDGGDNDVPWFYTDDSPNLPFSPSGGELGFVASGAGLVIIRIAD